jgi:hypothetical protein
MSTRNDKTVKAKTRKVKTILWLLSILFFFSLFIGGFFAGNKEDEGTGYGVPPYPQEVKIAVDSLSEFFDGLDSTLNVLRTKDSLMFNAVKNSQNGQ